METDASGCDPANGKAELYYFNMEDILYCTSLILLYDPNTGEGFRGRNSQSQHRGRKSQRWQGSWNPAH